MKPLSLDFLLSFGFTFQAGKYVLIITNNWENSNCSIQAQEVAGKFIAWYEVNKVIASRKFIYCEEIERLWEAVK